MKYYSFETLKKYVGSVLKFEGVCRVKTGVLEYDKGKLWLPDCGGVNACTVKVELPK